MLQRGPTALLAAVLIAGTGSPRGVQAAEPSAPSTTINLRYRVAAGCPSRGAIVEQLAERGFQLSDAPGTARLSIDVAVDPSDARRFRGQLMVEAPSLPTASRTVRGKDCQAVTLSLAVVAGLMLNPTPAAPPPSATDAAGARPPDRPRSVDAVATDVVRRRPTWLAGIGARGSSALGPDLALGPSVFVQRTWDDQQGGAFGLALSLVTMAPSAIDVPQGAAHLRAYLARLEACWWGSGAPVPRLLLSPCAGVEVGLLSGSGDIARPQAATRPWMAPLVSGRAALGLTRAVWVVLTAAIFAPLVRDTFVFNDPPVALYRTSIVGGSVELGVAAAFR